MEHNRENCIKARQAIRDTLDIVGGKWKLILIASLRQGKKKFNELSRECEITPRILSKELHELEINGLVIRKVCNTKPITVEYSLTTYSQTLEPLITAMHEWGVNHRGHIIKKDTE